MAWLLGRLYQAHVVIKNKTNLDNDFEGPRILAIYNTGKLSQII